MLFKLASMFFNAKVFIILVFPFLNPSPISINLVDISLKLASVCSGIISLLILKTFSTVAFSASVATIFNVCIALSVSS
ncbi:hypothetical protein [Clostridioides difficile]|uniref:hypothetical protein n=1 Tax=Clostridioides difficile TaxID=1496 RepID=UPI001A9BC503|nr:hypothetical protein [Clostridioides difficile]